MTTNSHNEIENVEEHSDVAGGEAHQEIHHEVTMYAEPIAHIGSFTITNALFTSWIAVFIIIILALILRFKLKQIPGRFQTIFEAMIEGTMNIGDQITGSRKITMKVFPISITVFFFVLINNWLGIMPFMGFGIVEHGNLFIPFLRGATADVNTTVAIAVISVIGANIFGAFSIGTWKMFNKYINLKVLGSIFTKIRKDPVIILVAPITFAVGLLEIIGEGAKIASLSLRLFGNVFAGEVLLVSMSAMLAYIVPIPFLFLEIFVGIIQAFIFAVLTTVYFTIASQDHDHEGHDEEHGAHVLEEVIGEETHGEIKVTV